MTLLLTFLAALLCVSGILWAGARVFLRLDERAEQWPLFWMTCLLLSLIIPLSSVAVLMMPDWVPSPTIEILSLHDPLLSLGLIPSMDPVAAPENNPLTFALLSQGLVCLYLIGALLNVVKLLLGRYRIHRIMAVAKPLGEWCEDDVLLSSSTGSPFAWTPFGRPKYSRIVVPEAYAREMNRESLTDILTHEREHIARRDDECGLILRLILCVCWVSPFAHGMFGRWSQSTEIQCDMAVTANRDPRMRKTYADTLLQAIHIMAGRVRQYPAASFSTHRIRNEKMRITHIMQGTRPAYKRRRDKASLARTASAVTIIGMISVSTTANAGNNSPQAADPVPSAPVAKAPVSNAKASSAVVSSAMVNGRMTSPFGPTADPFKDGETRNHYGVDIAAPTGTPIYAPANGVIVAATDAYKGNPKYGNVVALKTDGGVLTVFAHLDGFNVTEGQNVTQGNQIATVGSSGQSTGPHVHIETYDNGTRVDPVSIWPIGAN
jgi:murein DD-endopeptidase MepM/ murein hydrolase activator NlpD/Zn-dependent protease with chaperone function